MLIHSSTDTTRQMEQGCLLPLNVWSNVQDVPLTRGNKITILLPEDIEMLSLQGQTLLQLRYLLCCAMSLPFTNCLSHYNGNWKRIFDKTCYMN